MGIGMSIVVNKVKGICCVFVGDIFSVYVMCEYNDINVFVFGVRVIGLGLVEDIVKIWLEIVYEGGWYVNCVG